MKTQFLVVVEHARSFMFWSCLLPSFPAPFVFQYSIGSLCSLTTWCQFLAYCFLLVLSNKYSSLICQVSSQTGRTWQSNLIPSHLPDNAQNVTSSHPCPATQKKMPIIFPSTGIVPIAVFLDFSIAWFGIPVFLSHVTRNPSEGATKYHLISLCLVHLMKTMQVLSLECRQEKRSAVRGAYLGVL